MTAESFAIADHFGASAAMKAPKSSGLPGRASAVAVEIDDAALPEIVGTLAGEDTIFIAAHDQKSQRAVMKKIWELFG